MLEKTRFRNRIIFVSPGPHAFGGISAVVENYRHSRFWTQNQCLHFGTCIESASRLKRICYSIYRYIVFFFLVIRFRPSIVSVHMSSGGSFYRKFIYIVLSKCLFSKVAIHIHPSHFYDYYKNGNRLRKIMIRLGFRLSSGIIFLSKEMLKRFISIIPLGRILSVIPNPVDLKRYNNKNRSPFKGNRNILYLGWIIPQKGVYDIVDIIPTILKSFPDATFIFAGIKEVEKIRYVIRNRGLTANAKIPGWVEGKEKLNLLKTSRMLLLPSYTEGIPNVILESMATGLPAITTPVGEIPSVFSEGENGYYIQPGNREQLVYRIRQLLKNDFLCEEISRLTSQKAKEKYDTEVIGKRLGHVYHDILST